MLTAMETITGYVAWVAGVFEFETYHADCPLTACYMAIVRARGRAENGATE